MQIQVSEDTQQIWDEGFEKLKAKTASKDIFDEVTKVLNLAKSSAQPGEPNIVAGIREILQTSTPREAVVDHVEGDDQPQQLQAAE